MRRIAVCLLAALLALLPVCPAVRAEEAWSIDIRERLREFGYTIGEEEEYSSDETSEALRSFQIRMGLRATGIADEMTVLLLTELPAECSCLVEGEKKIYHLPGCPLLQEADPEDIRYCYEDSDTLRNAGFLPCEEYAPGEIASREDAHRTYYVLNANTHKFHYAWCASAKRISEKNRAEWYGTRDKVESRGYVACRRCCP